MLERITKRHERLFCEAVSLYGRLTKLQRKLSLSSNMRKSINDAASQN